MLPGDAAQLLLPVAVGSVCCDGVVEDEAVIDLAGVAGVPGTLTELTAVLGGVTSPLPAGDTLRGGVDVASTFVVRASSEALFLGDWGGVPAIVMLSLNEN